MAATIRLLLRADAEEYVALRTAMLEDVPTAFLASPEADIGCDLALMQERLGVSPDNAVYGAYESDLVGAVGILGGRHTKAAHRANIWGMYIAPAARRAGLGRALLARALHEACGFRAWGTEPGSLCYEGRLYDETHMALGLDVG